MGIPGKVQQGELDMNQKQINQFRYRESGMGQGQTFFWNGETGKL